MIYTALCIMFWMCAYPLLGEVGGGRALEISSFLGPKWHLLHLPFVSMPFYRAQKTLEFQQNVLTFIHSSTGGCLLCLVCLVTLVNVIGVIIFNILDSELKFSGKNRLQLYIWLKIV